MATKGKTQEQATPEKRDRFASVRDEAARNAAKDAERASTEGVTEEQSLKARPEKESSRNPEQVRVEEPSEGTEEKVE